GDSISTVAITSSTWSITAAGVASGFTELTVDNLKLDGNTLSSLTSGGITLAPLAGESLAISLSTTGDFLVNTDDFVVDTSTGNVGIGVTTPGEELTLASTFALGWDDGAGTADVTLYRSAANTLKTDDIFVVNNNLTVTGDLEVLGITTTDGDVDLGDTVVDTITFIGVVDSNIIPVSSSAYDLGSASLRWDNGYFDSITANTLTGVVVGGATSAEDWTINSDNATANAELSTLSFETGTGNFNAVLQWNASGDAGRVSGFDDTLLTNYPIAIFSQVSGPNQTFTSGTLFSYSQPLAHAITQSGTLTGVNLDFSSNITNASGNQTGIALTLKDGSSSGTATGLSLSGTADYGINLSGATIGTSAIVLPTGTTAAQGIDFGGDTNLYRSAADTLRTDDRFSAARIYAGAVANIDYIRHTFSGSFTSGGSSSVVVGQNFDGAITGASGDTTYISGTLFNNTVTTQAAAETITTVSQVRIAEPQITIGTATVTNSASLYIESAATEATNNYALWVDAGTSRFDEGVQINAASGDFDSYINSDTATLSYFDSGVYAGLGNITFLNSSSNPDASNRYLVGVAPSTSWTAAADKSQAILKVYTGSGGITASGTNPIVASAWFQEPNISIGANTVTTAATVYIQNAPTEGGSNYALFVDAGNARFDGQLQLDTADGGTSATGIVFGSTADTNLYRSAANTLKTDDSFIIGADLTITGTCTGCGGAFTVSGGIIDYTTATDRLRLRIGETGDIGLNIQGIASQTAN
ncbi:MAG: hypothetical protein WDZ44_01725, partial [Candidatus Spechtbacterales bacterium]